MQDEQLNPWTINSQRLVYENNWIRLDHFDVINPAGGPGIYGKVHFKNLALGIIPLDEEGNTWIVGQYRFTLDAYSWEICEGGAPLGSDPLEGARRELLEETGLVATSWERIMTLHLSNSVSDEMGYVYLARGLQQRDPEPEDTEQLSIRKLPFQEVYEMVMQGQITDAVSVAAILKTKALL